MEVRAGSKVRKVQVETPEHVNSGGKKEGKTLDLRKLGKIGKGGGWEGKTVTPEPSSSLRKETGPGLGSPWGFEECRR